MSARRGQVSVREWLWVLAWALVLVALTSLPYVWGWYVSSPEQVFSGFMYNVEDCNSYIAKMQQGRQGEWLFHLAYTPEEHTGGLFFLFYIVLGKIAAFWGWPLVTTYHLARSLLIPVLLAAVYHLVAYFVDWRALRRVATLLVAFAGGLGWLWVACGQPATLGAMPVDLWVPDGFAFLVAYAFPHLCLSQALLLWALRLMLQALERNSWRRSLAAGLLGAWVSLIHPYTVPVLAVLLGIYWAWQSWQQRLPQWRSAGLIVLFVVPSTPYLFYAWQVFTINPAFRAWRDQSPTLSPQPQHYLLGYGWLVPLAVAGAIYCWHRRDKQTTFLLCWAQSVPLLIYLPIGLQRRFIEGYQVPLATLAALGLARYGLLPLSRRRHVRWLTRFRRYTLSRLRRFAVTVVVLSTLPTNLFLVMGHIGLVSQQVSPAFNPGTVVRAVDWLGRHTRPDETVLAAFRTGNYIPARAGNRVFAGHGPETMDSQAKQEMLRRFFATETDDAFRLDLLCDFGVVYFFYGPYEQEMGGFRPAFAGYLKPVYDEEETVIYKVDSHCPGTNK